MNPAGYFPIFLTKPNNPIVGSSVIVEYLEELDGNNFLLNDNKKPEIRRLIYWFENVFIKDVISPILFEKIYKPIEVNLNPDNDKIRISLENFRFHLKYFNILIRDYDYLTGDDISYADIYFASCLSVLDYIGYLNFSNYEKIRDLYFKLKSRPTFKNILKDRVVGLDPSKSYSIIDY